MEQDSIQATRRPRRRHKALHVLASLASDVFSPLLMATYAMIIALWLTPMNRLPVGVRAYSSLGVFFLTAVIPALTVFILMRMGRVSDASISDRRQRPLPFMVTTVCYALAAVYIGALNAPRWLVCFLVAAALVAVFELTISLAWKISAHTGAAGGLAGFAVWLACKHALVCDPLIVVSAALLVVGILGWARLLLRRHTLGQVTCGAMLGFIVELGLLIW